MIVTTHKKANTRKKSLPLFFIIKKLKALCKAMDRAKPIAMCQYFLNPCMCIEIPMPMPKMPLATACSRVDPRKRNSPVSSPTVVSPRVRGFNRKKVFSRAAKPKAAVIIYIGQSIGSSALCVLYKMESTARYFMISSTPAKPTSCHSLCAK